MLLSGPPRIHILGLSETRLDERKSSEEILIPQYSFLRKDGVSHGRTGLGIYIHNSISSFIVRRPDLEPNSVECMWIEFKRHQNSSSVLIGFVYRNPAESCAWHDEFVSMMDAVTKHNNKILLLGDFNYDLMKPQPAWESTVSLFGLSQLIKSPTRITPTTSTLLDHIYTNDSALICETSVSDVSISDHSPVMCSLPDKMSKSRSEGHTTIQFRSFKNFNMNEFLHDLHITPFDKILQCTDATKALNLFCDMFKLIIDKHAPTRRKRVKQRVLPGWLTGEITEAMKIRDKLKRQKKFPEYRQQRNKVTTLVRDAKRAYFTKLINQNSDTATIWRAMNNITGKSTSTNKSSETNISADTFNDHFLSVASHLKQSCSASAKPFQNSAALTDFCKDKLKWHDSCAIPEMTVLDVGNYISKLKNKKSTGPDDINVFLLKSALPYIVEPLTYIYNLCIRHSVFPDPLKKAKVIPLPKTKVVTSSNDFRPISLLSVLSKPLENHIYKHLISFIEHHDLFHPFQSGFRNHHSCHTALVRMCDKWLSSVNNSEITGAVFLDFKKAFDLVDHNILIKKLSSYLQNQNTLDLICSFLRDRTQYVHVRGTSSKEGCIRYGVPQGSILGPLLFCLFINDLPLHIKNDKTLCEMFADDSTIHAHSSNLSAVQLALQHACDDVIDWCRDNEMVLHPEKTQCMVVTSRQKHQRKPLALDIKLQNNSLRQVQTHKVLGVYIDQELKWQNHIEHVCKTVSRNVFFTEEA